MKKFFLILIILGLFFTSCTDKSCSNDDVTCNPFLTMLYMDALEKEYLYMAGVTTQTAVTDPIPWITTPTSWLLKKYDLDATEDLANWNKSWVASSGSLPNMARDIFIDDRENIFTAGYGQITNLNGYIKKFHRDGNETLLKEFDLGNNELVTCIKTDNTNMFIGGAGTNLVNGTSAVDFVIAKLDSAGNEIFRRNFDGGVTANDWAQDIKIDSKGNIIALGIYTNVINAASAEDWVLIKLDANGNLLWQKTWGTTATDGSVSVILDGSDNIYISGYMTNYAGAATLSDSVIKKIDPNGNQLWEKVFDSGSVDAIYGSAMGPDGNLYFSGTYYNGTRLLDGVVYKMDTNGNLLQTILTDLGYNESEIYIDLKFDRDGNMYVSGTGINIASRQTGSATLSGHDLLLHKYDQNGSLIPAFSVLYDRGIGAAEEPRKIFIK